MYRSIRVFSRISARASRDMSISLYIVATLALPPVECQARRAPRLALHASAGITAVPTTAETLAWEIVRTPLEPRATLAFFKGRNGYPPRMIGRRGRSE